MAEDEARSSHRWRNDVCDSGLIDKGCHESTYTCPATDVYVFKDLIYLRKHPREGQAQPLQDHFPQ